MTTDGKILLTRRKIDQAVCELADKIFDCEDSHEIDLNAETTCYVQEERIPADGYREIQILSVEVVHDSARALRNLTNIAGYIARKLDRKVAAFNADEARHACEWEYQQEYETIGGLYI